MSLIDSFTGHLPGVLGNYMMSASDDDNAGGVLLPQIALGRWSAPRACSWPRATRTFGTWFKAATAYKQNTANSEQSQ